MAAAARLLNITPAAVAQQIRTLERQIGTPLIARAGRTVSVTEAGARILERARDILRASECSRKLDERVEGLEVRLLVGGFGFDAEPAKVVADEQSAIVAVFVV